MREGARLLPDFEALVQDVFTALVKLNARVATAKELPPSARVRQHLVAEVVGAESFGEARASCALRPSRAGMVALEVARWVIAALKRGELLALEEVRGAWELADVEEKLSEVAGRRAALAAMRGRLDEGAAELVEEELDEEAEELEARRGELAAEAERGVRGMPSETSARAADALARAAARAEAAGGRAGRGGAGGDGGHELDELAAQADLLDMPGVRRLLALVGALKDEALAARRRRVPRATTELYGVEGGAELERLLPSELAGLRHPVLKRDFRRRFAERALLGYALRGDEREGRGPAVFLLDVSGSMAGEKVVWAKAMVLAMGEVARREGRRVTAFTFSSGAAPRRLDLTTRGRAFAVRPALDTEGLRGLVKAGVGGGTDYEAALRAALAVIAEGGDLRRADVVLVTDGECHVSEAFLDWAQGEKAARDTRCVGVLVDVSTHATESLTALCDEVVKVTDLSLAETRKVLRAF